MLNNKGTINLLFAVGCKQFPPFAFFVFDEICKSYIFRGWRGKFMLWAQTNIERQGWFFKVLLSTVVFIITTLKINYNRLAVFIL